MYKRLIVTLGVLICAINGAQAQGAVGKIFALGVEALPLGRTFTFRLVTGGVAAAAGGVVGNTSYDALNNLTNDALRNAFKPAKLPDPLPPAGQTPKGCAIASCASIDFPKLVNPRAFVIPEPQLDGGGGAAALPVAPPARLAPAIQPPPPPPRCDDAGLDGLVAFQRAVNLDRDSSFAKRDAAAAQICYYVAAQQNIPVAQYDLADMLLRGDDGVRPDQARAMQYLEASAENGFMPAQIRLAVAYDTGVGIAQNFSEAFRWYRQAAAARSGYAQYQLSRFYYYGLVDGKKSHNDAFLWLNQALKGGYDPAMAAMNNLLAKVEADAREGIAGAQFTIGMAYEDGVPGFYARDLRKAFLAYREAAEKDWLAAREALQKLCSDHPAYCSD